MPTIVIILTILIASPETKMFDLCCVFITLKAPTVPPANAMAIKMILLPVIMLINIVKHKLISRASLDSSKIERSMAEVAIGIKYIEIPCTTLAIISVEIKII